MDVAEVVKKVQLGMTREEVKGALGEPTDWSVPRKRRGRLPEIYKYGNIELHFTTGKADGTLWLVYSEDVGGNGTSHLVI